MKTWTRVVLGVVGLYVALMLLSGLAIKLLLSGSAGETIASAVESSLPVPVAVGDGDFDLWQWFLFQPAISIQDIAVSNPEGFSSESLLEVREASAQVALLSLLQDQIAVKSFTLVEPRLRIERNSQGKTNVEELVRRMSSQRESAPAEEESESPGLSIDGFFLTSGTVEFVDLGSGGEVSPVSITGIEVALTDFAQDKSCGMTFQARPFEGPDSRLQFEGRAGPFESESLAAQGSLSLDLAPAEIPADYREECLGTWLANPGPSSRLALDAAMQGDLLGPFKGDGNVTLSEIQLGEDPENQLPLSGEAPLQITVQQMLTNPSFRAVLPEASLRLGAGGWNGRAELSFDGTQFQGRSSGSVRDVDINEIAAAFTSAKDLIFGKAEISEYDLHFSGKNADEMSNSLSGKGTIQLDEGRIAIFDLLATIEKHVNKLLKGESAADGSTNFTRLFTRLAIRDRHVYLSDLLLESPSMNTTGKGYFTFDQDLHFDLDTKISGTLAAVLGGKPNAAGKPQTSVPVQIRGNMDSPNVAPNLKRIAVEKVTGLLDSLFKKKD